MINPQNRFDGCRRACAQKQKHTKVPGECAATPPPEKRISVSRPDVGPDGHPIVVLDSFTQQELADLVRPKIAYLLKHHGPHVTADMLAGHVASTLVHRTGKD